MGWDVGAICLWVNSYVPLSLPFSLYSTNKWLIDRIIVCDQIGRGNFLGLYFSSGVVASFASLTHNVLRSRFHVYALGASGAVFGVLGAFTYFNPETKLTFIFLPFVALQAKYFMFGVAMLEAFGTVRGGRPSIMWRI